MNPELDAQYEYCEMVRLMGKHSIHKVGKIFGELMAQNKVQNLK